MLIRIDLQAQRLELFDEAGNWIRRYLVSTALNRAGEINAGNCTRGRHGAGHGSAAVTTRVISRGVARPAISGHPRWLRCTGQGLDTGADSVAVRLQKPAATDSVRWDSMTLHLHTRHARQPADGRPALTVACECVRKRSSNCLSWSRLALPVEIA